MDCGNFLKLCDEWKKDVCIFGAGEFGSNLGYEIIQESGLHISFYCDNKNNGQIRNGLKIYSADYLKSKKTDVLCIVAVFGEPGDEIVNQLNDMGIKHIFRLADGFVQWELAQYLDETNREDLISRFPSIMDDRIYLKNRFRYILGQELDLDNPRTFNEKIQWLKLYDRNPIHTLMSDKYAVKEYVANKIGDSYVNPTIEVWENAGEIDFNGLPNSFVVKCTHDSGSVIFCKNKQLFDERNARIRLDEALKRNYFWPDREWSYYDIPRRIIAEKFLNSCGKEALPIDYKVHCFEGKPTYIQVIAERDVLNHTARQNIYDFNWELLPWGFGDYPAYPEGFDKPSCLNEMYDISKILSEGIKYVRIDFYVIDGHLKFGEYTFYPSGGYYVRNEYWTEEVDCMLGDAITL